MSNSPALAREIREMSDISLHTFIRDCYLCIGQIRRERKQLRSERYSDEGTAMSDIALADECKRLRGLLARLQDEKRYRGAGR
jgi:hypothetical protein